MAERFQLRKLWREEAGLLGYTSTEVNDYVKEQEAIYDRETEKRLELEAEKRKYEAELEAEKRKYEAEEAQKVREHELLLAQQEERRAETQIRLAEINAGIRPSDPNDPSSSPSSLESTPSNNPLARYTSVWTDVHNPQQETFDVYLKRFIDCMEFNSISPDHYCRILVSTLRGENYETYCKLHPEDKESFLALRDALLNKHQLHSIHFKQKFKSATLKPNENYTQFIERIRSYLIKWVELGKYEQSFDGMVNLMLSDQLDAQFSPKLKAFLIQQGTEGLEATLVSADRFLQANKVESHHSRDKAHTNPSPQHSKSKQERSTPYSQPLYRNTHGDHRYGHINKNKHAPSSPVNAYFATAVNDNGLTTPEPETHSPNHTPVEHADWEYDPSPLNDDDQTYNIYSLSVVNNKNQPMTVHRDEIVRIDGKPSSAEHDTGLSYPKVISDRLVNPSNYTGRHVKFQGPFPRSPTHKLPTAIVHLESTLFNGPIEAAVIKNGKIDALLGRPIVGKCTSPPVRTHSPVSIKNRLRHSPLPQTKSDLRHLLNEFRYYRKGLILDFGRIAQPLYQMLKIRDSPDLTWDDPTICTFHTLQRCLGTNSLRPQRDC